jgi:hypothetical protein
MSAMLQALDRMRAASRAPIGGELGSRIDVDRVLLPLANAVGALEGAAKVTARPSTSTLEQAKKEWAQSGKRIDALSTRQIRALCWDPDTATEPTFVGALSKQPTLGQNRRWIEGLIESYIAQWRTMKEPTSLESTIQRVVRNFAGKSTRIAECKPAAPALFSASAPQWLGEQIINKRQSIEEGLRSWRVEESSGLGQATANAAIAEWTRWFDQRKPAMVGQTAKAEFDYLTKTLIRSKTVDQASVARALSSVVLWEQGERDETIHTELKILLLDRFGDPRLPAKQAAWASFDSAARRRAVGWLAKNDLLFFFKYVIRKDPHGRRDFWLQYIERAVDANVALSWEDAQRLRAEVKEKFSFSSVNGGNTSAFLMRFSGPAGDIVCVEFSETGNALYVYDAEAFLAKNQSIRARSFALSTQLKNRTIPHKRFRHDTGWQWTVRNFLFRRGIRE